MAEIQLPQKAIYTELDVVNKEGALKTLSNSLEEEGYVSSEYYESIIRREQNAPTGLEAPGIGFAIPHTEPQYVKQDSLSVAVLKNPVSFNNMANSEETVDVKVIFLLALSEETKHLNILKQIMNLVMEENMLEEILELSQPSLFDYLNKNLITQKA